MVNLKGTWSRAEAFPAFNRSTDDVYRFVSLLQCGTVYSVTCKVIRRDGYALLDCGCEDAVERASCGLILLYIVDIIWSLKTQSSSTEVSDVLVHFSFFGKATPSLQKKKKEVWFHNDLCSQNEMRQRNKNSRAEVESVSSSERVTEQSNTSFYFFFFFFKKMIPFVTLKNTTHRYEHSNDTSVTKTRGFARLIPLGLYEYRQYIGLSECFASLFARLQ